MVNRRLSMDHKRCPKCKVNMYMVGDSMGTLYYQDPWGGQHAAYQDFTCPRCSYWYRYDWINNRIISTGE